MRATYHKSIAKKRQRTFKECRLLTGLSLIIIGVVLFVVMSLLWSQFLFPLAFNSSLLFQLTIEKNDYLTCSSEYLSFLNNTADASTSVFSFYLFNVSNTADVIQRGDRPVLNQTGPFSYEISHFKYDVSFDENVSSSITYSEYSTLTPIKQSNPLKASCSRSFLEESVDCSGRESDCNCHNQDETITVINPLFSKVLWQENGSTLNAYFAKDVFVSIKSILENEFVTAIEMTLVPRALQEIASFRLVMQAANLLQTSYNTLLLLGYTNQTIISNSTELPFTCGLSSLGIPTCPWSSFSSFLINGMNATLSNNTSISPSDFPSASLFFDSSLNISFLSPEVGFSRWVGIMLSLNFINEYKDPAAITDNELTDLYNSFISDVLLLTFPGSALTLNNLLATEAMVDSIAQFLAVSFVNNYTAASFSLLSSEYFNTSYPVSCSPLNELCAWQWGAGYNLSSSLEGHIMDPRSGRLNSLTSIYSDSNAAMYYNAFSFCSFNSSTRPCRTQNATVLELAASQVLPSLLWGDDLYFNQIDPNELISLFLSQPTNVQNYYQSVACSLSRSVFYSYALSSFHEDYVIRFINKNKEGSLNHTFTSVNKQELGWAQFGSGGITFSVLKLRSIGQIRGNGVWATIDSGYASALIELSSW